MEDSKWFKIAAADKFKDTQQVIVEVLPKVTRAPLTQSAVLLFNIII